MGFDVEFDAFAGGITGEVARARPKGAARDLILKLNPSRLPGPASFL